MSEENQEYEAYLAKQKEKTEDPQRRQKWLSEEWDIKLVGFRRIFEGYAHLLKRCERALCLGARTGQEVVALLDMGLDAVGIDLVPCPPHVLEGDIHALSFPDASFDFVYTNIFDHALHPDRFCGEISRVLRPGGLVLMNLQIDMPQDAYTVTEIDNVSSEVLPLFAGFETRVNLPIPLNVHAMNWEVLLEKPAQAESADAGVASSVE